MLDVHVPKTSTKINSFLYSPAIKFFFARPFLIHHRAPGNTAKKKTLALHNYSAKGENSKIQIPCQKNAAQKSWEFKNPKTFKHCAIWPSASKQRNEQRPRDRERVFRVFWLSLLLEVTAIERGGFLNKNYLFSCFVSVLKWFYLKSFLKFSWKLDWKIV